MKITLETATFIDSLRKAEAIAPKKGEFADTTYGIILEPNALEELLVAKATDGIFFYMESIPILSIEGDGSETWRVPSSVFYGSVSKLPSKMGSQVTVENEGNQVVVKSGRTVIKIPMMGWETFPEFDFYDSSEFREFTNITGKSNKLKWATSNINSDPKSCVYVRGDKMYATNNFKAARIVLDADTGVTALYPPLTLSRVVPFGADVRVSKEHNHLIIAPDDYSQLLMQLMDDSSYPANNIDKMMEEPYQYKSSFSKAEAIRMLDGVSPLMGKDDADKQLIMYIGKGELAFFYASESGSFGDRIEARGDCEGHARIKLCVTQSIIKSAIESMADSVEMEYAPGTMKLRFNDGNYQAVIALRREK